MSDADTTADRNTSWAWKQLAGDLLSYVLVLMAAWTGYLVADALVLVYSVELMALLFIVTDGWPEFLARTSLGLGLIPILLVSPDFDLPWQSWALAVLVGIHLLHRQLWMQDPNQDRAIQVARRQLMVSIWSMICVGGLAHALGARLDLIRNLGWRPSEADPSLLHLAVDRGWSGTALVALALATARLVNDISFSAYPLLTGEPDPFASTSGDADGAASVDIEER